MGKYTVDYFIDFFSKIPEEKWCIYHYYEENGKKCALGHLGSDPVFHPDVSVAFIELIYKYLGIQSVTELNDGEHPNYQQKTPKQRILSALQDVKKIKAQKK